MLNKILFILIIVLGIGCFISYTNWQSNKERADRMTVNYKEAVKDNHELNLKYKELTDEQRNKIDKLTDSLKIKPKTVKEFVEVVIVDSIPYPVETIVTKIDSNTFEFNRDTACFHIKGLTKITSTSPIITITELTYNNTVDYIVYTQRREWKFLFIKCRWFGKKETKLEVVPECGETTVQKINLIKK